jgi:hypothetical protein
MIAGFNLRERGKNWMIIRVSRRGWLNIPILQGPWMTGLKPNVSGARRMCIRMTGFVHGGSVLNN